MCELWVALSYTILMGNKTYAEKDVADMQREAEARKSMTGMEPRDQD